MVESLESDWLLLWTGVFYTGNKLRLGALPLSVLLISARYLYKRHLGARNLSAWEGVKYLFPSLKCKSIYNIFDMCFSGFFCCYSVSHCSNKPTIKMIDCSFLCQWANVQNLTQIIPEQCYGAYHYVNMLTRMWSVIVAVLGISKPVWEKWPDGFQSGTTQSLPETHWALWKVSHEHVHTFSTSIIPPLWLALGILCLTVSCSAYTVQTKQNVMRRSENWQTSSIWRRTIYRSVKIVVAL